MSLSMYHASIPVFLRMLGNLAAILDKADADEELRLLAGIAGKAQGMAVRIRRPGEIFQIFMGSPDPGPGDDLPLGLTEPLPDPQ